MRVEILKSFVVLAERKNLSTAAQELCYSEASVVHHIRELEKLLGVNLFARRVTHVDPTGPGLVALAFCKEILRCIDGMSAAIQELQVRIPPELQSMGEKRPAGASVRRPVPARRGDVRGGAATPDVRRSLSARVVPSVLDVVREGRVPAVATSASGLRSGVDDARSGAL